jgi:hypothetical protein
MFPIYSFCDGIALLMFRLRQHQLITDSQLQIKQGTALPDTLNIIGKWNHTHGSSSTAIFF